MASSLSVLGRLRVRGRFLQPNDFHGLSVQHVPDALRYIVFVAIGCRCVGLAVGRDNHVGSINAVRDGFPVFVDRRLITWGH